MQATSEKEVKSILEKNHHIAVLLLYNQECQQYDTLEEEAHYLSQEYDIPLIKIDVQKFTQFAKCTNIREKPSFALIKGDINGIFQYKSQPTEQNIHQIFKMGKKLQIDLKKQFQDKLKDEYETVEHQIL